MLDWMLEVFYSFHCEQECFFLAVDIMDKFLEKVEEEQEPEDIHLLGVTCIFMASKFHEISPFSLSTVVTKMTHGKFS